MSFTYAMTDKDVKGSMRKVLGWIMLSPKVAYANLPYKKWYIKKFIYHSN